MNEWGFIGKESLVRFGKLALPVYKTGRA